VHHTLQLLLWAALWDRRHAGTAVGAATGTRGRHVRGMAQRAPCQRAKPVNHDQLLCWRAGQQEGAQLQGIAEVDARCSARRMLLKYYSIVDEGLRRIPLACVGNA
jgi:hypothetical protein